MAKTVELRRHTDADGDVLTLEGVRAAVEIGNRMKDVSSPRGELGRLSLMRPGFGKTAAELLQ